MEAVRAVHAYVKAAPDPSAAITKVLAAIKEKAFVLKREGECMELVGYHLVLSLTAGYVTLRKGEEKTQLRNQARTVVFASLFSVWVPCAGSNLPCRRGASSTRHFCAYRLRRPPTTCQGGSKRPCRPQGSR